MAIERNGITYPEIGDMVILDVRPQDISYGIVISTTGFHVPSKEVRMGTVYNFIVQWAKGKNKGRLSCGINCSNCDKWTTIAVKKS